MTPEQKRIKQNRIRLVEYSTQIKYTLFSKFGLKSVCASKVWFPFLQHLIERCELQVININKSRAKIFEVCTSINRNCFIRADHVERYCMRSGRETQVELSPPTAGRRVNVIQDTIVSELKKVKGPRNIHKIPER